MGSSGILEYGRPGEFHNYYASGSDIEVNLERQKFDFRTELSLY